MSVKLLKLSFWRILITIIIAIGFYYFEFSEFNSIEETALVLIVSYLIAYLLGFFHQQYRIFFKRKAVFFDLGGVVTKGDYFTEILEMRSGIKALIKKLRKKNVVALLSNQNWEAHKLFEKKFKLDELFDVQIVSGKEKVKKPDPRIYKIALRKARVKAKNSVFIDDQAQNLEPASSLGMKTIHFQSVQQISQELKKNGFL
jgi:HAD superfamily hydrolase (TIGR01509 family)